MTDRLARAIEFMEKEAANYRRSANRFMLEFGPRKGARLEAKARAFRRHLDVIRACLDYEVPAEGALAEEPALTEPLDTPYLREVLRRASAIEKGEKGDPR